MKLQTILMSLAVVTVLFVGCENQKKKEAEEQAKAEQLRMERERDSLLKVEEDNRARLAQMEANSITAKTMASENLSTWTTALQSADMAQTLKGEGEYTVFAPTNDAFEKLPKGKLDELLKPENKEKLQELLKYHVVSGVWTADDLRAQIEGANNKFEVTTLDGEKVTLSAKNDKLWVKDAKGNTVEITSEPMEASNGVIYSVNKVLMPATKL